MITTIEVMQHTATAEVALIVGWWAGYLRRWAEDKR